MNVAEFYYVHSRNEDIADIEDFILYTLPWGLNVVYSHHS